MVASPQSSLSPDSYLALEAKSPVKHEYIDGDIYAMAGASDAHVTIALNLAVLLRNHVRGSNCRVYIADMKARVEARNRFFYPDIMVTCDRLDQETALYKRFPKLIVEVFSDSTEAFDRGEKFIDYQSLDSLEEYVLINPYHQRVECFRRGEAGQWILQYYTPDSATSKGSFELESLGFADSLATLYEDVQLDPTPSPVDERSLRSQDK